MSLLNYKVLTKLTFLVLLSLQVKSVTSPVRNQYWSSIDSESCHKKALQLRAWLCPNILLQKADGSYPMVLSTQDVFSGPDATSQQDSAVSCSISNSFTSLDFHAEIHVEHPKWCQRIKGHFWALWNDIWLHFCFFFVCVSFFITNFINMSECRSFLIFLCVIQ